MRAVYASVVGLVVEDVAHAAFTVGPPEMLAPNLHPWARQGEAVGFLADGFAVLSSTPPSH